MMQITVKLGGDGTAPAGARKPQPPPMPPLFAPRLGIGLVGGGGGVEMAGLWQTTGSSALAAGSLCGTVNSIDNVSIPPAGTTATPTTARR